VTPQFGTSLTIVTGNIS